MTVAEPVILYDTLPRTPVPYMVPDGAGERYTLHDELVTVKSFAPASGGHASVAVVAGGRNAGLPMHTHEDAGESLLVLDGRVQVWFGNESRHLAPGDYLSVPPGVPHGHRFLGEAGRVALSWAPAGPERFFELAGTRTQAVWPLPPSGGNVPEPGWEDVASEVGMRFVEDVGYPDATIDAGDDTLPDEVVAYVLRDREGVRTGGRRQLVTALQKVRNSNGHAWVGTAAYGDFHFFPRHFHRTHTELFLILEGRGHFFIDGNIVAVTRGDYVHVPVGTQHCFEFVSPYGRFWSVCAPGHFEPFFDWAFEPTDSYLPLYGNQTMTPEILERVDRELDHVTAGPAPRSRPIGLDNQVISEASEE